MHNLLNTNHLLIILDHPKLSLALPSCIAKIYENN